MRKFENLNRSRDSRLEAVRQPYSDASHTAKDGSHLAHPANHSSQVACLGSDNSTSFRWFSRPWWLITLMTDCKQEKCRAQAVEHSPGGALFQTMVTNARKLIIRMKAVSLPRLKAVFARTMLVVVACLGAGVAGMDAQNSNSTLAGWKKYAGNPVLGGDYGTCFDISVMKEGRVYRMWFSWRPKASIALVESQDGFHFCSRRLLSYPRTRRAVGRMISTVRWSLNKVVFTACGTPARPMAIRRLATQPQLTASRGKE